MHDAVLMGLAMGQGYLAIAGLLFIIYIMLTGGPNPPAEQ